MFYFLFSYDLFENRFYKFQYIIYNLQLIFLYPGKTSKINRIRVILDKAMKAVKVIELSQVS